MRPRGHLIHETVADRRDDLCRPMQLEVRVDESIRVGPAKKTSHHAASYAETRQKVIPKTSNVERRTSDVGCRTSDVGCRMSNVGCRMSNVGRRMSTVEDHSQPGGKSGRSLETTTASVPLREGAAEHKNPVCARHERKRSAQPGWSRADEA